jgi:hypothetical protein
MSAVRKAERDEGSDEVEWDSSDDDTLALPDRPRRQWFNRRSAALLALITCAAGFYAGIRVEKGQLSSSSNGTRGLSLPSLGTGTGSQTGAPAGFPAGGIPGRGNSTTGTISSVAGNSIYITDVSGNTVKVTLSSATKISKSVKVAKHALRPGDSVTVEGLKNSKGTVSATSVNDSGASNTAGSGSGSSAGAGGGSAAVSSLFGSGNGG